MNLLSLRDTEVKYRRGEGSAVAAQLGLIISKRGFEIFRDVKALCEEIEALQLPQTVRTQLRLIFQSGAVADIVYNSITDFSFINIDNAVHNAVSSSGLKYGCVMQLVADIFYACGLDAVIEYGPQLVDGEIKHTLHAMMPPDMAVCEPAYAETLVEGWSTAEDKEEDEKIIKEAAEKAITAINGLCAAGIPRGFSLLGRCYMHGECGTDTDLRKALELMKLAAGMGDPEAAAFLGDIFYMSDDPLVRDYTLAHHYYTRPGALAMGDARRAALRDIYRQQSLNRATLAFNAVLVLLTAVFASLFHTGLFSGANLSAFGVIVSLLSAAVFGAGVLYHIRKKFNNARVFVAAQFAVWFLYASVMALA